MSVFNSAPRSLKIGLNSYKSGLLVGYLLNPNNYMRDGVGGDVLITADTSTVPVNVQFADGMITDITDIVDLHARTLWLGNVKILIAHSGRFWKFVEEYNIGLFQEFDSKRTRFTNIYCTGFIEGLILNFSFWVNKRADLTKAQVYPPFLLPDGTTSNGTTLDEKMLDDWCAAEMAALDSERGGTGEREKRLAEARAAFDKNEFKRGIRDGFSY